MLRSVIVLLAAGVWAVQEAREFDNRGVQLAQSGNLTAAIDQFRAALGADPMYADGWYHLGLAYSQSQKTDEAMASCEEELRVYPDYLAARYMLADCCHKRGDLQGELNLLAELVRSAPEFAEARYNFGLSLKNDGKVQRAAEELRAAVRLSSRTPDIFWHSALLSRKWIKTRR